MKLKGYCFFLFLVLPFLAISQENQISGIITDRPDQTESPFLILKGYFQIETGFSKESLGNENFSREITTYNTSLVRVGVLDNLEMRIGAEYLKYEAELSALDKTTTGLSPLMVGAKVGIAKARGVFPEIGLLGHVFLPFAAHKDLRPATTGVDFRFAFMHDISERSNISYNIGAEWMEDSSEATYIYTLAYGFDLLEGLGIYAELYGGLPEDSRAQHHWDAGFAYQISPNFQIDAYGGTGIDSEQELLFGAGLSLRLPN